MMNDEQKKLASGFANTPSIVPNYTANRRGARIDTRPATYCPWKRWATHEGPMRPSVWSIHILPPREKEAEFQTRTSTKFRGAADDNYNTKTHMLGLQWERIGQRHRPHKRPSWFDPPPVFLVASRSLAIAIASVSKTT